MENKNIKSPLPIIFICGIVIVAVLNMNTFTKIYKTNIIEAEAKNKQIALSSLETEYQNNIIGKTNYLDLNGLFSRLIDKKELNSRYKLNNGYLTNIFDTHSNMDSEINNISNLKTYLDLYDIPFAYVQTPHLIPTDEDPMIPAGYETHVNGNSDRLLEGIENNGISYLDLRKIFKEYDINHYDMFYSTDPHWTTEAGFISHKYITQFIDEKLGEKISIDDYFVDNRYDIEVFENISLGSHGQRTGVYYANCHNLSVITPKFKTNFTIEFPDDSKTFTGEFSETHVDYESFINEVNNAVTKTIFTPHLEIGYYVKITNNLVPNNKVIFILRDSFSRAIVPFLSLHYSEVHVYDIRGGEKQEGFIKRLHEINPDIVLQVRITSDVLTDEAKAQI